MTNLPFLGELPNVPLAEVKGTWVREGSCDQCAHGEIAGECCTKLALPVSLTAARNPDILHFFELHGVSVKWWGDLPIAVLPLRCQALDASGDCSLYGQPDRPDVCSAGPLNPWAAQLSPACSYKFSLEQEP